MLSMAECGKEMALQDQFNVGLYGSKNCWVIMENGDGDHDDDDETYSPTTTCSSSSSIGNCTTSAGSSLDVVDDDDASSSHSNGPLYELSELMAHLPIKRGLSKYFQGKSQSFTSLSKAVSVLDLAKKENPYTSRRKMKSCSSYGGGLDAHKLFTLPKPTISKKTSRRPFSSRGRSS